MPHNISFLYKETILFHLGFGGASVCQMRDLCWVRLVGNGQIHTPYIIARHVLYKQLSHFQSHKEQRLQNDAANEDDNWRRTQSRRKQRGLAFVKDPLSTFHLLSSLALASIVSPLTNISFRFCNSDRADINTAPTRREEVRVRRRIKQKGPEAFEGGKLHFDMVRLQAEKCTERLWLEVRGPLQAFTCTDTVWPSTEPVHAKFACTTEDILRNVAGVKWRVLGKFDFPPWSFAPLSAPGIGAETVSWQENFHSHNRSHKFQ